MHRRSPSRGGSSLPAGIFGVGTMPHAVRTSVIPRSRVVKRPSSAGRCTPAPTPIGLRPRQVARNDLMLSKSSCVGAARFKAHAIGCLMKRHVPRAGEEEDPLGGDSRSPPAAAGSRPGRLPVHDRAAARVAADLAGGGEARAGDRGSPLLHRRPARGVARRIPSPASLYKVGTVGVIMRMRKLSDGGLKILVQGLCRARIQRFIAEQPCYQVRLDVYEEVPTTRSPRGRGAGPFGPPERRAGGGAGAIAAARAGDGAAERGGGRAAWPTWWPRT